MSQTDLAPDPARAGCFRSLPLREEYRSDSADLIQDFYEPCLAIATSYDRAVGYFTSHGLALAARGLEVFASGARQMRLVASPMLSEEDLDAITRGLAARESLVERRLLEALRDGGDASHTLVLAWLIAESRLDFRIAVPRSGPGIFHEKAGLFHDADGCVVAFSGSANETVGGLVSNFEAIDVFFSWDGTRGRVERKAANFERLWTNETPDLDVLPLPAAVERELIRIAGQRPRGRSREEEPGQEPGTRTGFGAPAAVEPRPYQSAAIEAWFAAGGRGMLSMATGSGKTKTSLFAAVELFRRAATPPSLIVVTPFIHLVDQWAREIEAWGLRPIRCYEAAGSWETRAWEAVDSRRAGASNPICLVSTVATASGPRFLRLMDRLPPDVLFVADEVHHLGADQASSILSEAFPYRLGLSATPERWRDDAGNRVLDAYFGGVVFEFGIGAAIEAGCLSPYEYLPVLVDLEPDELEDYRLIMAEIDTVLAAKGDGFDATLRALLNRRSDVLNTARGKLDAVRRRVTDHPPDRTLLYCASREQMGAVSDLLRDRGTVPWPFTAEEDRATREQVLERFAAGAIPALVAMRALDEGVDVPATREAQLLASSGNPREFIQRRGRVLRISPGKTLATIVDYVVVPEIDARLSQEIVTKEVRRVLEFAGSAMNADAARQRIWGLLDRFHLLHLVGEHM